MASRKGSAIVVPSPLRTVRRGNDFVRNAMSLVSFCSVARRLVLRHQKRGTLRDPENERRPAVILRSRAADDPAHGRLIVVFEPAPQRIGQQLFGNSAGKLLRLIEQ